MRRFPVVFLSILLACPAADAAVHMRTGAAQFQSSHLERMAGLAPSLRDWVREEARRTADSVPDVEVISQAVRMRLSGQNYTDADVDALVQLVLMACVEQADADLRAAMEEMRAVNEEKRAMRESVAARRQMQNEQKKALRDSYADRAQLPPPAEEQTAAAPAARVSPAVAPIQLQLADPVEDDKDSLSESGEMHQLRLQLYQERRSKAIEALSNLMKKSSETASSIISNLK